MGYWPGGRGTVGPQDVYAMIADESPPPAPIKVPEYMMSNMPIYRALLAARPPSARSRPASRPALPPPTSQPFMFSRVAAMDPPAIAEALMPPWGSYGRPGETSSKRIAQKLLDSRLEPLEALAKTTTTRPGRPRGLDDDGDMMRFSPGRRYGRMPYGVTGDAEVHYLSGRDNPADCAVVVLLPSEDIVRFISRKKEEPEWLLDWRLKQFLEMRGADGGPWRSLCALPAFWVGLLYDNAALEAAWALATLQPQTAASAIGAAYERQKDFNRRVRLACLLRLLGSQLGQRDVDRAVDLLTTRLFRIAFATPEPAGPYIGRRYSGGQGFLANRLLPWRTVLFAAAPEAVRANATRFPAAPSGLPEAKRDWSTAADPLGKKRCAFVALTTV
ncbi:hypothetical protein LCGC14_2434040 [marine sediment metagenome]|uniref:Uncharacterized protein n=1 Tax=marine sediment metagenome TaxID=412755 RepID=A0A0F9C8D6_9ZZZZ